MAEPAFFEFRTSVRELVEFVHRRGGLGGDGLFQSSNRGVEGTRGHRRLQRSRGYAYEAEIPVERTFERNQVRIHLSGRIDGIIATDTPPVVEEIKTFDRGWDGKADPVHLAQLRVYAALLADERSWAEVERRLTYYDLELEQETPLSEIESAESLKAFLDATLEEWFDWLDQLAQWRRARNESLNALAFPLGEFREGQRSFAAAVFRTIRDGGTLFAEAPTGLGKTMATFFPAAKALPLLEDGQVFYVTAKTPGRHAAEEALEHLRAAGAKLRSVTLTAKRKVCFSESPTGCDLRTCPYALGYFDRIKPAVRELLAKERIDRPAIEETARAHQVCPFELSLDASLWTDVVVGDFNYVFDPTARLQRHFLDAGKRHVVLVDEAHNLVDRSREMHSASLSAEQLETGRGAASGKGITRARRALASARTALQTLAKGPAMSCVEARDYHDGDIALEEPPRELLEELGDCARAIEAFLVNQPPGAELSGWLEPYFEIQAFLRAADGFDETCRTILSPSRSSVRIYCADASKHLKATIGGLRAAIFFSATLSPIGYFRELLGGADDTPSISFPSPFRADQMHLTVLDHDVSFKGRSGSLAAVARAVASHVQGGNHLVFAPSLSYLAALENELTQLGVESFSQSPSMDEAARDQFLAQYSQAGSGVGLAVLGGIFAEGIDLPGERLVGVTVIGVGLPRLSLERDILLAHFQASRGAGFDYAYRFPGIQRVLQAVGRLIRTESDRGRALLIDRRFRESRYRSLFPAWWNVR